MSSTDVNGTTAKSPKNSSKQEHKQHVPHLAEDPSRHTFLKVAPSLFTAAKLPLFDSLDLYTTLIRSSEALEQGERLRNLSWRIMNKALLKDHELNKSKKRDGVKNLYRVINPAQNGHLQEREHPKKSVEKLQPLQIMSAMKGVSGGSRTPVEPRVSHQCPVLNHQNHHPQHHQHHHHHHHHHQHHHHPHQNIHHQNQSPSGQVPARVTSDLQAKRGVHKPHELPLARPQYSQGNVRFTLGSDGGSRLASPEPVQQPPVGVSDSQASLVKKGDSVASLTGTLAGVPEVSDSQRLKNSSKRSLQQPPSAGSLFATRAVDKSAGQSAMDVADHKPKSLFGPPVSQPKSGTHASHDRAFYSSDEDESDWNSLSDDSELYDEEEDERYYQKQWDKLMFSRNDASRGTHSSRGTSSPGSDKQDPKRSLLSGLFLNEMAKKSAPPIMSSLSVQHPTLEKSSVTAVGDVTPSSSWKGLSAMSEAMIHDKAPIHSHAHAHTHQPKAAGYLSNRRGSFSSIISDSTRQRYKHESNAPPTAQTILPTALSTHMFLPNNVHQQRMAKSSLSSSSASSKPGPLKRRESMDIPSKNSTNSFLKTRMELSEEQYFARAHNGR
ncbi:LAME_0D06348g1_1 [Lachancea meyersii CBS 8951]|uniref:LAME_0D06348g1_1 n=1 Tax=Lachancea meyersii CBS 8951 TaxID=1266667 RepID=A0A1G4J941_9SACH|nr:LAME_0D06348g1_1 [Lachancea meyersii CBS 8951]